MEAPRDFFISYNHKDRNWAEWIAWTLEEQGYTTIIQTWDFRPGSNFIIEMRKGLDNARRILAVLSPNYLSSGFAQAEYAAALAKDPTGEKGVLVPVMVSAVELGALDAPIIRIDLLSKVEEECKSELLNGIKATSIRPSYKPAFPGLTRPRFPGTPSISVATFMTLAMIGLLLLAGVYFWMEPRPFPETAVDLKSTRQETAHPTYGTKTAMKKPVGTLTLEEDKR
jgi:hypothetical protein